jgi:hypothetical protein
MAAHMKYIHQPAILTKKYVEKVKIYPLKGYHYKEHVLRLEELS